MLDDKDIKKLIKAQKEAFQEDFAKIDAKFDNLSENFVTKKEFEGFMEITATKQDLEKFTTKEDLRKTDVKVDKIINILGRMDEKLDETNKLKHRVEYIETTLNIQPLKMKS
jgi:hypothetical protein